MRVEQPQKLDLTEEIEVVRVPLPQVLPLVMQGKVCVSGSVALCFLALQKLGMA